MASVSLCPEEYVVQDMGASSPLDTSPNCTSDLGQRDTWEGHDTPRSPSQDTSHGTSRALGHRARAGFVQVYRDVIESYAEDHQLSPLAEAILWRLITAADWKGPHRGSVTGFTLTDWHPRLRVSRNTFTKALRELDAAELTATDLRAGHDGTVRVLIYDEATHDRHAQDLRESPVDDQLRSRNICASDPLPSAQNLRERPAETTPKNARAKNPPTPQAPEEHSESPRAEAVEDPKHDLGKVRVQPAVDALRARCERFGTPMPDRLPSCERDLAAALAAGWEPRDLAEALCAPPWPVDGVRHPDAFFAKRLRRLGPPPPNRKPRPGRECPACSGSGMVLDDDDLAHRCTYCDGSGRIDTERTA